MRFLLVCVFVAVLSSCGFDVSHQMRPPQHNVDTALYATPRFYAVVRADTLSSVREILQNNLGGYVRLVETDNQFNSTLQADTLLVWVQHYHPVTLPDLNVTNHARLADRIISCYPEAVSDNLADKHIMKAGSGVIWVYFVSPDYVIFTDNVFKNEYVRQLRGYLTKTGRLPSW